MKIGKSTWRRTQSNGSKDDLRSWKNNGGIDGEDQELLTKELENLNNRVDNTITEMKNTPEGDDSRQDDTVACIGDLEERKKEVIQKEKINENSLRDLWENIRYCLSSKVLRRKRLKMYLRILWLKFSKPEGNWYSGIGSTKHPKVDEQTDPH